MNFRKIKCGSCVLVLIVLMLMGCEKKVEKPVDVSVKTLETQSEYVEGAVREIMTKMVATGEIAKRIRTRRSLAVHILKDHTTLMANFISKQSEKMDAWMGPDVELYSVEPDGTEVPWKEGNAAFWSLLYEEREEDFEAARIMLEVNVKDIRLEDAVPVTLTRDCLAQINYEFRVLYKDENGDENSSAICIYGGKGGTKLCHRNPCPWDPCELKFESIL